MAQAAAWYGRGVYEVMTEAVDWETDTIKVALLERVHTPNTSTHQFFSDVSGSEASGTGYTAGGATLAGKAVTYESADRRTVYDANNVSWDPSSVSAGYAVIYKDTGTASTSPLLGIVDFGEERTSIDAPFNINWNAAGILRGAANALA
jgi:hypothetical protein